MLPSAIYSQMLTNHKSSQQQLLHQQRLKVESSRWRTLSSCATSGCTLCCEQQPLQLFCKGIFSVTRLYFETIFQTSQPGRKIASSNTLAAWCNTALHHARVKHCRSRTVSQHWHEWRAGKHCKWAIWRLARKNAVVLHTEKALQAR